LVKYALPTYGFFKYALDWTCNNHKWVTK
jgi:hypothetical protein